VRLPAPPFGEGRAARSRALSLYGAALFLAGLVAFMGIITAEALYPAAYTTGGNEISDLGSTRPPDSVILQPSAHIFNSVMMAAGVLTLLSGYLLWGGSRRRLPAIFLGLFGLGALGVGIFPGNHGNVHALSRCSPSLPEVRPRFSRTLSRAAPSGTSPLCWAW
jgi:hypothetical membrane protein